MTKRSWGRVSIRNFGGLSKMLPVLVLASNMIGLGNSLADEETHATILFGGDVVWSLGLEAPKYVFGVQNPESRTTDSGSRRLPFIQTNRTLEIMQSRFDRNVEDEKDWKHYRDAAEFGFGGDPKVNPFKHLREFFRDSDFSFVNLETPLSDTARWSGKFRTPTSFANTLSDAGIDIVSTANNHALDAEGQGLEDTIEALRGVSILHVGTGENLEDATKAVVLNRDGIRIAILAFTYAVNPTTSPIGFATARRSGAAPLDEVLIAEKIAEIRDGVDVVVLSLHWGLQNTYDVHRSDRVLAHRLIDAGADLIVGHHPHVPRAVERYQDGLIIYSLGNLIFSHGHSNWGDNLVAKVTVSKSGLKSARFWAVSGKGREVFSPRVLDSGPADEELGRLVKSSREFETVLTRDENWVDLSFEAGR